MNPDTLYDDGNNDNWDEFTGLDPDDPDNYDPVADEDEYGSGIAVDDSSDLLRYDDIPDYDPYNDPDNY